MRKYWKIMATVVIGVVLLASGVYSARRLYIPVLTATRVSGSLIPLADDTDDLGINTLEWRNMWIDGTANIDTAAVGNLAVTGTFTSAAITPSGNLLPGADDTYNLGSAVAEWRDLYIDHTAYIDTLDNDMLIVAAVQSDLTPSADDTYNLGSDTLQWQYLWVDGIAYVDAFGESLIPAVGDAYDIGTMLDGWRDLYLNGTANISHLATSDVASNLIPSSDDIQSLGIAALQWKDLYVDGTAYVDTLNVEVGIALFSSDIDMTANGNRIDLDTDNDTSLRCYTDDMIYVETGGTDRFIFSTTTLGPLVDDAYDLGSGSIQWKDLFIDGIAYIDTIDADYAYLRGDVIGYNGEGEINWLNAGGDHAGYARAIDKDNSDAVTAGAGEDDLQSYTIPAGALHADGGIIVRAAGTKANGNSENKTIKLHFGGSSWTIHAAAANANDWRMEAEIVNTATNAQRISWNCFDGITITQGYETASIDTTGAVTVKLTGECATGTDTITQTMWSVVMY